MYEHPYLLSDFDFHLPERLLAVTPLARRDDSRLMVISKSAGLIEHYRFKNLPELLQSGDRLIFNDTKVIPARLEARKASLKRGALLDVLLIAAVPDEVQTWAVLIDPLRKVRIGTTLIFGDNELQAMVVAINGAKDIWVRFSTDLTAIQLKERLYALGAAPLPPYLRKAWANVSIDRYQTVYAAREGALAAPTAGLHFTQAMLEALRSVGISKDSLTLHVGLGTFDPLYVEDFRSAKLHSEWYEISEETAQNIRSTKESGSLVVAVGTTVLRALESSADADGSVTSKTGHTDIFIQPGYKFRTANVLFTNFHTPRSTLLILIAAFMGYDLMRESYAKAIEEEYRFYSFGDAMLILP